MFKQRCQPVTMLLKIRFLEQMLITPSLGLNCYHQRLSPYWKIEKEGGGRFGCLELKPGWYKSAPSAVKF